MAEIRRLGDKEIELLIELWRNEESLWKVTSIVHGLGGSRVHEMYPKLPC